MFEADHDVSRGTSPRSDAPMDAANPPSPESFPEADAAKKRASARLFKESFAASERSRSSVSYSPTTDSASTQSLLERAVAARTTMSAWCNLMGTAPPAAVASPLPEQLTMIQVCMPPCVAASLLVPSPNAGVRCPSKPRPMQVRYLESQVEEMRPDVVKQLRLASGRHQVSDADSMC